MKSVKKEALFAEWVESYNQGKQIWYIALINGNFIWMLSSFYQGSGWGNYHSTRDWIVVLVGMCLFSLLFSISYSEYYTIIEGKDIKTGQMIWDVVYRMPFSEKEYYKIVEKSFQKVVSFIGLGVFIFLEAGLFVKITKEKKEWGIQFSQTLSKEFVLQNLLFGILVVGVIVAIMYLGFFLCKHRNLKYLNDRKKGKVKKVYFSEKKKNKEKKEQKRMEKRRIMKGLLKKDEELWKEFNYSYTKKEQFAKSFGVVLEFFGIAIWFIKIYCERRNIPLGISYMENSYWLLLAIGSSFISYGEWRKSKKEGVIYGLCSVCAFVAVICSIMEQLV